MWNVDANILPRKRCCFLGRRVAVDGNVVVSWEEEDPRSGVWSGECTGKKVPENVLGTLESL